MERIVLTPGEAAQALGVSRDQVYVLLQTGALAGVKTSSGVMAHWRIPRQALDDFLGVRARLRAPAGGMRAEDV